MEAMDEKEEEEEVETILALCGRTPCSPKDSSH